MKKQTMIFTAMIFLILNGVCFAGAPRQVGGFELGKYINDFKDRLQMDAARPIRHQEYLTELEIKETKGFKSGYVWTGNCLEPGRILRIKLKYDESSKKFFNELLKRFKKRFGEPSEWRGDPFHIVISWKWSFIDEKNNRISLILQHNTKDEEEKIGNAVKLTITNLIEEERLCHEKKSSESQKKAGKEKNKIKEQEKIDWEQMIPQ
jgi:hypothetical protein